MKLTLLSGEDRPYTLSFLYRREQLWQVKQSGQDPLYCIQKHDEHRYDLLISINFWVTGKIKVMARYVKTKLTIWHESLDKMRIYKNGYTTGFPVLRTDTSYGRKQQRFNTFCFKSFAAERTPDPEKAKGFVQRIVEVNCFAGNPPCDISELVNPAGDQENQNLRDELLEFRNILLIYKLVHFHEPISDIKDLNIKNREKAAIQTPDTAFPK